MTATDAIYAAFPLRYWSDSTTPLARLVAGDPLVRAIVVAHFVQIEGPRAWENSRAKNDAIWAWRVACSRGVPAERVHEEGRILDRRLEAIESTLAGISLASEAHLLRSACLWGREHSQDADCAGTIVDNQCVLCGVSHGDPCPDCGGEGYHAEGCASADGGAEPGATWAADRASAKAWDAEGGDPLPAWALGAEVRR